MNKSYSKKAIEHFLNPNNMGVIEDANGVGEVGNPQCGDLMTIYIKVENNVIQDMKFKTLGCAAAIATSDMICEVAKGKKVEEALRITHQDLVDELGELPATKVHCAGLAQEGLKAAVKDYEKKE